MEDDLIYELSEGNPGALSVLVELDYYTRAKLKDMGISGQFIWVGYKDICKESIKDFRDKVNNGSIKAKIEETPDWKYKQSNNKS